MKERTGGGRYEEGGRRRGDLYHYNNRDRTYDQNARKPFIVIHPLWLVSTVRAMSWSSHGKSGHTLSMS